MRPVDAYIVNRPPELRDLMAFLHAWLQEHGLQSKISYGIPFYSGRKNLCYLNPQKTGGLEMCFLKGQGLFHPLLRRRGRKQVKGLYLESLESIPIEALEEVLSQALALDAQA